MPEQCDELSKTDPPAAPSAILPTAGSRSTGRTVLLAAAILLFAFNLRPAVSSLGAVLDEVSRDLDLSHSVAGLLTALPVLCFAATGAVAASLARKFGIQPVLAVSMIVVSLATLFRATTDSAGVFVVATMVTLGGMATGNVLLPAFVKAYFPDKIGTLTAAYTATLAIGTTTPAALTVPISDAFGDWRWGLAAWALTAAIAAVPWVFLAVSDRQFSVVRQKAPDTRLRQGTPDGRLRQGARQERPHIGMKALLRSRTAWALAIFFGIQAIQAYAAFGWLAQVFKDAGLSPAYAGLLLSIMPIASVPMSLAIPAIAARMPNPRVLVIGCGIAFLAAYLGLWLAPSTVPYLWVILLGIGGGSFPLVLTMIGMRSREYETTARLSGFVQSIGYVIAAIGPLAIGALYGATDGWTVPLILLAALVVPQVIAGVIASRPRYVDDDLLT